MAISTELSLHYENNPWAFLDRNERDWLHPVMLQAFQKMSVFRQLVPVVVDTSSNAFTAQNVTYNVDLGDYEPNTNPSPWGELFTQAMRSDTGQLSVKLARHTWKEMTHDYERRFTYWQQPGARAGLAPIVRDKFAPSIVRKMDLQARNAFAKTPFRSFSTGANWASITSTDDFDLDWALQARLRRAGPRNIGTWMQANDTLCLTTSGAMFSIENDSTYNATRQYTETGWKQLHEGVTARHKRVQFVECDDLIFWNAGAITKQVAIRLSAPAGSGGADWGTYTIGQAGATKYLPVSDFLAANFKVNDVITIHLSRGNAAGELPSMVMSDGTSELIAQPSGAMAAYFPSGVAYGVNPFDGYTFYRTVKSVDATVGAAKLGLDKPLFWDFTTDLVTTVGVGARAGITVDGGGAYAGPVFGYVTKGINIHASIFVYGPGAVVMGANQLPTIQDPEPFDDHKLVWRHTANGYYHYQPFRPELCHVIYHTAPYDYSGVLNRNV